MTRPTIVEHAAEADSGARWFLAALQVNPFVYNGAVSPSASYDNEEQYNAAIVDACKSESIELVAVTDHWSVDGSAQLLEDLKANSICALPGFEANTSEGVHVLVMFPEGTPITAVNAAIGGCGVEPGCPNGTTGNAYSEIVSKMTERGALVVPAHINASPRGLLHAVSGTALQRMLKHPDLCAVAVSPEKPDGPEQSNIIARRPPFDAGHPLAVLYADDVSEATRLTRIGAVTWFKGRSPKLDSIQLAIRTPETRVSLDNPEGVAKSLIRAISWDGGFLDGVHVNFSNDLTALIGGRGTGKSTTIESIRYVMNIEPRVPEAAAEHRDVIKNVLRPGTTVSILIELQTTHTERYIIRRTVPDGPIVFDAAGEVTALPPIDVLPHLEVFGQHELAEIAHDKPNIAKMLERFGGETPTTERRNSVVVRLRDNRASLARAELERDQLEEALADLPRLRDQVARYEASGLTARLDDHRGVQRDQSFFDELVRRVGDTRQAISDLQDSVSLDDLARRPQRIDDSPRRDTLVAAYETVQALSIRLAGLFNELDESVTGSLSSIEETRRIWSTETSEITASYTTVLRELSDQGLEADSFLATTQALESLERREEERSIKRAAVSKLQADRDLILAELASVDADLAGALRDSIRRANEATGGAVSVRPIQSPDRSAVKRLINRVKGQRTQLVAAIDRDDFTPRALVSSARRGVAALAEWDIRGAQATAFVEAGEALWRELEETSIELAAEVYLDVGTSPRRNYRALDHLSKGQRATALLLLLLSASDSPLVIDQPEDDLDNRFVFEGVVRKLRELKGIRQIIVTTHNANVPVLGDAELVQSFEGNGDKGWTNDAMSGSLDEESVRRRAEDLLEGGREAFEARRHLYGF